MSETCILHFEDSGRWCSLPEWAEYFINIGRQQTLIPKSNNRLVTAVVVPTRAFGATFVGMGMVISEASLRDTASKTAHFNKLLTLAPGTPVLFRDEKGKALKGLLQKPEEYGGKIWIRAQVQSKDGGGLARFVDESRSLQIQPVGEQSWKLPKEPSNSKSRLSNNFVDQLLGRDDPVQLGLQSKLVCALVGQRNTFEYEIKKTPLAVHVNGDRYAEGQLQDVLRVDKFVASQQSHRSALVTTSVSDPPEDVVSNVKVGVVFDGAAGFLKWGCFWQRQHQIIILDRADPYFDDAIHAVNARFSQKRITDGRAVPGYEMPPGTEILQFWEACL